MFLPTGKPSHSYNKTICPHLPLITYKNGANSISFFFFLLNIVDVSVIKPIFGHQWVYPILCSCEESGEIKKGKCSNFTGIWQTPALSYRCRRPETSFLPAPRPEMADAQRDTCTNSWSPTRRTSRDRWTQPGENKGSTLIKGQGHPDSLQGQYSVLLSGLYKT